MENGLAQGIGGIAFLVGVMAFWQKDDLRFRYQMMAFCFIMGVHFALLGATVAAIGVVINGIRSFASIKTQSRKVMWFFIALMWLMTLPNITHFFELLTVIGSSVATWALFFQTRHRPAQLNFIQLILLGEPQPMAWLDWWLIG